MDFEAAILSHTRWKRRLHASMAGEGRLDPAEVGADDHCDLGRWLHEEAGRFAEHPDFQDLVAQHAAFHRAAGRVVDRINDGNHDEAHRLLGFDSEFAQCSLKVVDLLGRLRRHGAHA